MTGSGADVTARRDRPRYLAGKAKMARDARAAAGYASAEQLALQLGVSASVVKQHESRAYDREPRLGQMLAVREYGLHLAGVVAEHHGARIEPASAIVHGDDHGARLASVTRSTCDVLATLTAALADGALTGAEPSAVRVVVKGAVEALRELDAACIAAEWGQR